MVYNGYMKKASLFLLLLFSFNSVIHSDEIDFPPELLWWINEAKKANNNIEVNNFVLAEREVKRFDTRNYSGFLIYPVFMRWNYSGNLIAYYNYHSAELTRQRNGKYLIHTFDDVGTLFIADRNKNIFFADHFGSMAGFDAIYWLRDYVLVGVGSIVNLVENVDIFIKIYTINNSSNTVEIKTYHFENAFTIDDRNSLKLNWFQQRLDYFELEY